MGKQNQTKRFKNWNKKLYLWSFGNSICTGKINIDEAEIDQTNLLKDWKEFSDKSRPITKKYRDKIRNTFESLNALYEGQELILNAFRSSVFPMKEKQRKQLKILTPKQMIQRIPIALAQVIADNTSKDLLNEIRQIMYSLYRAEEITKKVYSNIINSIKV